MREAEWDHHEDRTGKRLEALLSQALVAVIALMGLALCWRALP